MWCGWWCAKFCPSWCARCRACPPKKASPSRGRQQTPCAIAKQTVPGERCGNLHKCSALFRSSTEGYLQIYSSTRKTRAHEAIHPHRFTKGALVSGRILGRCWGNEPQSRWGFIGVLRKEVLQLLYRGIPSPDFVDGRVDQQLEKEGSEDAADHWCGNTFHYVGAGSRRPHNGKEADAGGGKRHELRTQTLGSPLHDGFVQLPQVLQAVFALCLLVGQIEVQQHEYPCLSIDSQQGNQSHPYGDAHVVASRVQKPDRAYR